jgi:hypothetical protein
MNRSSPGLARVVPTLAGRDYREHFTRYRISPFDRSLFGFRDGFRLYLDRFRFDLNRLSFQPGPLETSILWTS